MGLPAPWTLQYDAQDPYPAGLVEFGSSASDIVLTSMPSQDPADTTLGDTARPWDDGTLFGEDFAGASNITFDLEVNTRNETQARAVIDRLRRVWRGDAVRRTPGAVATLTAHTGRMTFGRPRQPKNDDKRTFQGRASITAEFLAADDLWYGPEESESVQLVQRATGGVVAPVVAPVIATSGDTNRSTVITVAGEMPTWVSSRINGPIIDPIVELVGRFRFGFDVTLAYDEWIDVVATPYGHVILRNGSRQVPVNAASSLIRQAQVPPGRYELVLRGKAGDGTPSARAFWRPAYPHW